MLSVRGLDIAAQCRLVSTVIQKLCEMVNESDHAYDLVNDYFSENFSPIIGGSLEDLASEFDSMSMFIQKRG